LGANLKLKRGNPRELKRAVVYEFESERTARDAEKLAHVQFREFRHQKEWFHIRGNKWPSGAQSQGFKIRENTP